MKKMVGMWVGMSLACAPTAFGYETDQLSGRDLVVPDVSAEVNRYVDQLLDQAMEKTQKKIDLAMENGAPLEAREISDLLRKKLYREFPVEPLFFGTNIEKWMTEDLASQGYALEPSGKGQGWLFNIYDEYKELFNPKLKSFPGVAVVFEVADHVAGTYIAPTFMAKGSRIGADKLSHFFRLGYRYFTRSNYGTDDLAAKHYGTTTEKTYIGYKSSGAFSYADLASNYDGYLFFKQVIDADNPYFVLDKSQTLKRVRGFKLEEYVNEDWDEYLNPCLYQPAVEKVMQLHFTKNRERVCAEYRAWRNVNGTPHTALRPVEEYVDVTIAPERHDPFRLAELCGEGPSAR